MPLAVIPDAEALIGGWLRTHPDIVALGANVAPRTPSSMSQPWVRVTQLDAPDNERAAIEHLIGYLMQFDCYAGNIAMNAYGGQAKASLLGRTVRSVLKSREGFTADAVVVCGVRFTMHRRVPDETTEPAHERVILIATVGMHAVRP